MDIECLGIEVAAETVVRNAFLMDKVQEFRILTFSLDSQ